MEFLFYTALQLSQNKLCRISKPVIPRVHLSGSGFTGWSVKCGAEPLAPEGGAPSCSLVTSLTHLDVPSPRPLSFVVEELFCQSSGLF